MQVLANIIMVHRLQVVITFELQRLKTIQTNIFSIK